MAEDFDCHGYTFTHGAVWIDNNEVQKILDGDGYTRTKTPKVGDIMIQKDKNNQIVHSAIVTGVNLKKGEVTVEEAIGVSVFQTPDGKPTKLNSQKYKIDGSQIKGTLEFYNRPQDKVIE